MLSVNKTYERIYIRDENGHRTQLVLGPPKTAESRREIPLSEDLMDLLSGILPEKDPESFLLSNSPKPMEQKMRCIETVSFSSLGDDQADASKVRVRRRRSDH